MENLSIAVELIVGSNILLCLLCGWLLLDMKRLRADTALDITRLTARLNKKRLPDGVTVATLKRKPQ
ncbi:MAG: hypothetical protein JWN34_362 [Bryobacterales bacterium]|nr:hypothetical protein [Bryobacterales bacterium]